MIFNIKECLGTNEVPFGMPINQVRQNLAVHFNSFKRTPASEFPCDFFETIGFFVYYKKPGIVNAIEFSLPSEPLFKGNNLFHCSFLDLKAFLLSLDADIEIEADSLTSYKLGIGAYAPEAEEEPTLPVESIIVFEQGYYDKPGTGSP